MGDGRDPRTSTHKKKAKDTAPITIERVCISDEVRLPLWSGGRWSGFLDWPGKLQSFSCLVGFPPNFITALPQQTAVGLNSTLCKKNCSVKISQLCYSDGNEDGATVSCNCHCDAILVYHCRVPSTSQISQIADFKCPSTVRTFILRVALISFYNKSYAVRGQRSRLLPTFPRVLDPHQLAKVACRD